MDLNGMYDAIMELQAKLEMDHDDPELHIPDYRKVKALAACYELQDYLSNAIAAGELEQEEYPNGVIDMDRPYLVGPGWWSIIDRYMEEAHTIDPDCTVEVKEKFGTLRADIMTENDDTRKTLYQIAQQMEQAANGVCEACGGPGRPVSKSGWYLTLCDRCASLSAVERRKVDREVVERYHREKAAQSLFGILPPDAEETE